MNESETRDEDLKRLEKIIKIEKEKTAKGTSVGSVEESILNKIGK